MSKFIMSILVMFFLLACKTSKQTGLEFVKNNHVESKKKLYEAQISKLHGDRDAHLEALYKCIENSPNSGAFFQLSKDFFDKKEFETALIYINKAIKIDENEVWFWVQRAKILTSLSKLEEANLDLKRVIQISTFYPEFYLSVINNLINNKKFDLAIILLSELEKKFGLDELIVFTRNSIYSLQGNHSLIVKEIEKLESAFPYNLKYKIILADEYLKVSDTLRAGAVYRNIYKDHSLEEIVVLGYLNYLKIVGKHDRYLKIINDVISQKSFSTESVDKLLMSLDMDQTFSADSKSEVYKKAIDSGLDSYTAYSLTANALVESEKYSEARKYLVKAIGINASEYKSWEQLLILDEKLNDHANLKIDSENAAEYFPNQPVIFLYQGIALLNLNLLDKSIEALEYGKSLVFDNKKQEARFHYYMAEVYVLKEKWNEAFDHFQIAITIDEESCFIRSKYAYYLLKNNLKLMEAESMIKKCLLTFPDKRDMIIIQAYLFYRKGEFLKAKETYFPVINSVSKLRPNEIEFYGDILFKNNEKESAVDYWKKALNMGGSDQDLMEKISLKHLKE